MKIKTTMAKKNKIILISFTVFVLFILGIPQILFKRNIQTYFSDQTAKEVSLEKAFKSLMALDQSNNTAQIYDEFLLPSDKTRITKEEFVKRYSRKTVPYSDDFTIHSITIDGDRGLVERTRTVCLSQNCSDKDKVFTRIKKEFYFINGEWHTPLDNNVFCARTSPYEIAPEFERALSLIIQRFDENEPSKSLSEGIKAQRNCLSIEYTDFDEGAEGYFIFDSTQADLERLPIYVSRKYQQVDDISTALLLSHELMHVIQFTNTMTTGEVLSCYQQEVNAFFDQYNFALSLNPEEKRTLTARIAESSIWQVDKNPQVQIAKELLNLSYRAQLSCNTNQLNACWRENFLESIERMVKNDPFYQKQCGMN